MSVLPKTPATLTELLAAASAILPRPAALLAAADWCWETKGGASLYANNGGNLTCGAVPGASCGSNPLVTSGLSFASFPSLDAGAAAYVAFLKKHGAYNDLLTGNLDTFSAALARIGYAGSAMPASGYSAGMGAWLPKLEAVVLPPPSSIAGITFNQGVLLGAMGITGIFLGSWAADGFRRPKMGRANWLPRLARRARAR